MSSCSVQHCSTLRASTVLILTLIIQTPETGQGLTAQEKAENKTRPRQSLIRISRETTYLTEPLDLNGYVDYVQAFNQRASRGVTPQNNFEAVVRSVMPPDGIPEFMRAEYFSRLGLNPPESGAAPDQGTYYQTFVSFSLQGSRDRKERDRIYDEQTSLMSSPWQADQHPEAARWVAANGKHLDRLAAASQRTEYYTPYLAGESADNADELPIPQLIGLLLPSLQQQREIARGLAIRALGRIANKNHTGAWHDILAIYRVSRKVEQCHTLIAGLVAYAIDGIAFQTASQFLKSPALRDAELKQCLADLKSLPGLTPTADRIDFGERLMGLDTAISLAQHSQQQGLFRMIKMIEALSGLTGSNLHDQLAAGCEVNAPQASAVDWNTTLVVLNQWYDRLAAATREPDFKKRNAQFDTINSDLEKLSANVTNRQKLLNMVARLGNAKALGEAIGKLLVALLLPAVQQARKAEDRTTAQDHLIQLAFAAELYRRQTGQFPADLTALSPRFLPSIPLDPCSGTALKYIPGDDQVLVYSVGRNGVDDQGRTDSDAGQVTDSNPDWDDIVVRFRR